MEIVHDDESLQRYMQAAVDVSPERPILIDKFLENAIEAEADAIADGTDAFVPAVMEHIEEAGVHSGDSACVIPPVSISEKHIATISEYTRRIAIELNVVGLMNIQYAICNDTVYILEANPRASRTVPLVSKVCGISMARSGNPDHAWQKAEGSEPGEHEKIPHYGVKEAVLPFYFYPEVDPVLGPEMRSTGEVLGMADSFGAAFYKAQDAAKSCLPLSGKVLMTVADRDKRQQLMLRGVSPELGFSIVATSGTRDFLQKNGIEAALVNKMHEARPHVTDCIKNGDVQLVINTPLGKSSKEDDSSYPQGCNRLQDSLCYHDSGSALSGAGHSGI